MFVETVTACIRPAWATITASRGPWHRHLECLLLEPRKVLRALHRGSTNEHWLAGVVALDNVVDDRFEFGVFTLEDEIGLVLADHVEVRRNPHDLMP